ncbi:MAG: DUF4157 domain-containing protein [Oscillospiraceae bacterium]
MAAYQDEILAKAKPKQGVVEFPLGGKGEEKEDARQGGTLSDWIGGKKSLELPGGVRGKMEGAFGADLGGLKLFESPEVGKRGFNALSQGNQIGFDRGAFSPSTRQGQELLGHELSHVVSQAKGQAPRAAGRAAVQEPSFEARADAEGTRAARGDVLGGPQTTTISTFSTPVASLPVQGGPKKWLSDAKAKLLAGKEWVGEKASQASQWVGKKGVAAGKAIDNGIYRAIDFADAKSTQALDWASEKLSPAGQWISGKAGDAKKWLGDKADAVKHSSAGRWISGKTGDAKKWLGDKANAAKNSKAGQWIGGKVDALKNSKAGQWVGGKADAAREKAHEIKEAAADKIVAAKRLIREHVGTTASKQRAMEKRVQRGANLGSAASEIMKELGLENAFGVYDGSGSPDLLQTAKDGVGSVNETLSDSSTALDLGTSIAGKDSRAGGIMSSINANVGRASSFTGGAGKLMDAYSGGGDLLSIMSGEKKSPGAAKVASKALGVANSTIGGTQSLMKGAGGKLGEAANSPFFTGAGMLGGAKSFIDAGTTLSDAAADSETNSRKQDDLRDVSVGLDAYGKGLSGTKTIVGGVGKLMSGSAAGSALSGVGSGLGIGIDLVKAGKSGVDIASASKDIKGMRAVQDSRYNPMATSTHLHSDKRMHNVLGMGIDAREHDRREAISSLIDSSLGAMGGIADVAGAGGLGSAVTGGLRLGNKIVTGAVQSHYDSKAQKERINQEFSALSDEGRREKAVTLDEATQKTRARLDEMRDSENRSDGKKTRYTQADMKAAISRSIAGNSKGDEGIHTAIIAKYVFMLRDPSQIEKTSPILDAFGFDVGKIKEKIAKAQNEEEVASALPSEEAIAKALGFRGKKPALDKQMSRTKAAIEQQKAKKEQEQQAATP